jgi:hypothetical protein
MSIETFDVGRHRVMLSARKSVGPPTPYTLLLAGSIPDLSVSVSVKGLRGPIFSRREAVHSRGREACA